ncbi:MAG: helix-turn-helix domain-containing protein [Bacteroidota bacterium]
MLNKEDKLFLVCIGEKVRKYRLKNNLSQNQLAFEINSTLRQIQRIEAGTANASIIYYRKIAQVLEIDFKELIK